MRWITGTDLKNWSSTRDCQENLPLLIRKLIRATSSNINNILFPSGDNVLYGGWDGVLNSSIKTEYIPLGTSLWEFGTEKTVEKKINKDYDKRKNNPLGYNPEEATFVFVTPHIWTNKDKWIKVRKRENYWKEIIVYDNEYLEEWIEQAPAVGAWLSKYLEIYPDGVEALEDFWNQWISNPKHKISPGLVTAGRTEQVQKIADWLDETPSLLQIKSTSKEESLAFLCAAIESFPQKKEYIYSKSLIVENEKNFKAIAKTKANLIVIPYFEETVALNQALENSNHVYNPLSLESTTNSDAITLPRIARDGFLSALEQMGFSESDSQKLSKKSARVLSVFRRILQYDYNQPEWAKRETSKYLIPILLAGKWDGKYLGDVEFMNVLTGTNYDDFISTAKAWTIESDPPLLTIGDKWRLTSPIDAWSALSPFLTKSDIIKFEKLVLGAIVEKELLIKNDEGIFGIREYYRGQTKYSNWLKEGICQSLIMIAVFGESYQLDSIEDKQDWVDKIISKIMHQIDAETIFSINPILMLLAEASPKVFLSSLGNSLMSKSNNFTSLFKKGNDIFATHQHTRLLFALEMLAWDPLLLNQVVSILIELIKLDPGITIANKPSLSLYHIFLPWCPQTNADLDQRNLLLESVINREPKIGWQLLISLLPGGSNSGWFTTKYQWRQISQYETEVVTYSDLYKSYDTVLTVLLSKIDGDLDKLSDLFDKITHLYYSEREKLIQFALSHSNEFIGPKYRINLSLRDAIMRSRAFMDTNWALSIEHIEKLETLYSSLSDSNDPSRHTWLFESSWPTTIEYYHRSESYNDREYFDLLKQERVKALKVIYSNMGINGVWQFVDIVKLPEYAGEAFANILDSQPIENCILSLLDSANKSLVDFSKGFVKEMSKLLNDDWIKKSIIQLKSQDNQEEKIANFILSISRKEGEVISLVNSLSENIQTKFWQNHNPHFFDASDEDIVFCVKKLVEYNRYATALTISSRLKEVMPSQLIVDILQKLAFEGLSESESKKISTYDIEEAVSIVHERTDLDDTVKGGIEWLYVRTLEYNDPEKNLVILLREIGRSPSFFRDLVAYKYKPEEPYQELEESIREDVKNNRAIKAIALLYAWCKVPGTDSQNIIDDGILTVWVQEVRELCLSVGRLGSCDHELGSLFGRSPLYGAYWPQEPVCKIIEEIGNEKILSGFHTAIINKRGVYTKSIYEGGTQEKALAERYKLYAKSIMNRYPKVANELLNVAKAYEQQARGEDYEAIENDLEN